MELLIIWFTFSSGVQLYQVIMNVLEYDVVELSDEDYPLGLVGSGENSRTIKYIFLWAKLYTYRRHLFHNGLLDM